MGTGSTRNRLLNVAESTPSQRSAQAALVELARLLARQAARELAEDVHGTDSTPAPSGEEPKR
jgi:hypothetical protein